MSNLIELHNIEQLLEQAEDYCWYSDSKLISGASSPFEKSIIKFDPVSVCEVFGYQIASSIGINVPKMQGFWVPETINTLESGRIGILIEYHKDWARLSRDEAAKRDSTMTARALALCVFDRFEWGEFGLSQEKVYFVDLERLLPPMLPDHLLSESEENRIDFLDSHKNLYKSGDITAIEEVLDEAESLGLQEQVEFELRILCTLTPDIYCKFLEITGHPLSTILSSYASHNFGSRLNSVANWFKLPTHEAPSWR